MLFLVYRSFKRIRQVWLILSLVLALMVGFTPTLRATPTAPDYTVTIAGNTIVVTDVTGNGDTLAVSQPSAGNMLFAAAGRNFSINGGPDIAGNSGNLPLAGVTSITINEGNGNDTLNITAFTGSFPSLTINGDAGNDTVNFNGDITFATNANLDVNMQNDTATPGNDVVTVANTVNLIASGTGSIDIRVSHRFAMTGGGTSLDTVNGNLTIEANQQATPTAGNFVGVDLLQGATFRTTGSGQITVKGRGGNTGTLNFGVRLGYVSNGGGNVLGGTGTVTIEGTGGASNGMFYQRGVVLQGYSTTSRITTTGGNIIITGTGGGVAGATGVLHVGVDFEGTNTGSTIVQAGGSGSVTITGVGGQANGTCSGGPNNFPTGVGIFNSGQITAGGNITLQGTGGTGNGLTCNNMGIQNTGPIRSTGGSVSITGIEGVGASSFGLNMSNSVRSDPTGNISIFANSAILGTLNAGTNTVTVQQITNGVGLNLGGATDTMGGPLTLSNAEMVNMTAGTINIGDSNSGAITVSGAVNRTSAAVLNLTSGGAINLNASSLNSFASNVNLTTGSTVSPAAAGADVSMGATGTLNFNAGADLALAINGTTVDSQYQQLNIMGLVNLTGVDLVFTGTHVPAPSQSFTLVNNDGTDAITGTFNGLAEGALIPAFLGSGLSAEISYVGGTGNDVVIISRESNILCGIQAAVEPTVYNFFSGANLVSINVTNDGSDLDCIRVTTVGNNHLNALPTTMTGKYWRINGLQSDQNTPATIDFMVDLTLPFNTADAFDKVCRYTGSGWDCAATSFVANTSITRMGVIQFSDWAVGSNAGPTAITLGKLSVIMPSLLSLGTIGLLFLLLAVTIRVVWRRIV